MRNQTFSRLKIERDGFIKEPIEDLNAYPVNVKFFC